MASDTRIILEIGYALEIHGVAAEIPHRLPNEPAGSVVLSFAHVDEADGAEEILAPCSPYVGDWIRMDALHIRVFFSPHAQ
jgi:hypothetical protein